MISIVFYFCCAGLMLVLSLSGPIFVSLLAGETAIASRLSVYLLLGGFLFAAPILAIWERTRRVPHMGGLVLVVLVWLLLPVLAAIPILDVTDLGMVDSLFEAVSGFTTTGASVVVDISTWSQGMTFWRSQLQWLGGFFAMMTILLVLAPMGIGGLNLNAVAVFRIRRGMASWGRMVMVTQRFGIYYIIFTGVVFLILVLTGTRPFYAANLAMTAVSTGGFLPFNRDLDITVGVIGLLVMGLALLIAATSVFWQRMITAGQWSRLKEHRESYSIMAVVLVIGIVLGYMLIRVTGAGESQGGRLLAEGLFNAASLVSTSGIESRPGIFTLIPLPIVLFVILLGGSAFSTSGGLKHYRVGAMAVQSWSELDRLVFPHAVRPSRFGTQFYDLQLMKSIWSYFMVALVTIGVGTVIVATASIPFEAALTATVSAFTTAGPVYQSGFAPPGQPAWPQFFEFTVTAKLALCAIMVLGRIEVLALLGIFSTHYWRTR